jgi:large subunit ribosomal protein L5
MTMKKSRLYEEYVTKIKPSLQKDLALKNVMEVPKINKIVLNVGAGKEMISDSKIVKVVNDILGRISGQKAITTKARKSIAGFKIREGMSLGSKVTLRGQNMYEFLDRLINIALPTVRDFQGVTTQFDRRGNYNLGIKEWGIFPEVDYDVTDKVYGLNVTINTTAKSDAHAFELLKKFGMPFRQA